MKNHEKLINYRDTARRLRQKGFYVPESFERKVEKNLSEGGKNYIYASDIENGLKLTGFWKPYAKNTETYTQLVLTVFEKLFKNQCMVVNSNVSSDFFIGNYMELNEKPMFEEIVTTVMHCSGKARLQSTSSRYHLD